jgi:hypothetical protein
MSKTVAGFIENGGSVIKEIENHSIVLYERQDHGDPEFGVSEPGKRISLGF